MKSPFLGRDADLDQLGAHLDEGARLLTLVGPPGVGKTRLALELAHRRSGSAEVSFCELAEARTVPDLLAAIGAALGMARGPGTPVDSVGRAAAARGPLLVILDNFEQLVPVGVPAVEALLAAAPETRILVTSQTRLGCPGELVQPVAPLPLEHAVELFAACADRVRARSVEGDRAVIEELVERLDRSPLAIELAAARLGVLTPKKLLGRLERRFELLATGAPGRHRSLDAAIGFAWELLAPTERSVLAQCAVFSGGFSLEAAEAVVTLPDGASDLLAALETLVQRSLVHPEPVADLGDEIRFSLYESIRAFAARELEASGERDEVLRRHERGCVEEAEMLAARLDGPDALEAMTRLGLERDNLAAVHRRTRERAPALAARAALALHALMVIRGPGAGEPELLDAAVEAAEASGEPRLIAASRLARAGATARRGHMDEARDDLELALPRAQDDARLRARLYIERARAELHQGNLDAAAADLDAAGAEARRSRDLILDGTARNLLGRVTESRGDMAGAARHFEEALSAFRRAGSLRHQGIALTNLGVMRYGEGRLEDARALLEEALELQRRAQDVAAEADTLLNLGSIQLTAGRLEQAEVTLRQALAREREVANRRFEGLAVGNLAIAAHCRGNLRLARDGYQRALGIFSECGERRFHGIFLPFFAAVEAALGLLDEARADFAEARAYVEDQGDAGQAATLEALEGFLDLARARGGDRDAAVDAAGRRLAAAQEALARPAEVRSSELRIAARLLERSLSAHRDSGAAATAAAAPAATAEEGSGPAGRLRLDVGPEARWFRLGEAAPVDLRRRAALRLLLIELVEHRLQAAGAGLSPAQLFAAGWPGERALPEAAAGRVYTAIRTLRRLGLEAVLLRQDDGYLLDPDIPIVQR